MVSRRNMIACGIGTGVLAALGYRAFDRGVFSAGQGEAYRAWSEWQGIAGEMPAKRPIHAAILAANAHNTQPWIFEPGEDAITLYADLSRHIGTADPFRRELYASLGCALANLKLAFPDYDVFPARQWNHDRLEISRDETPVAAQRLEIRRHDVGATVELFPALRHAIPHRHTNRGPYRPDRQLPNLGDIFYASENGIDGVAIFDPGAKRELGALIVEATERFVADSEMSADSARWFRTGRKEIERNRDGITTDTAGLSPVVNAVAKLMPDQNAETADRYWLAATRDVQIPTAAAFGVIFCTDRLERDQAIFAGERWQRSHLWLTTLGLAAQPLNQPIEIMDRDHQLGRSNDYAKDIRKIAGVRNGDPAFIFRLGYGTREAPASARRRFGDVLMRNRYA
jgi:hypothetical protein